MDVTSGSNVSIPFTRHALCSGIPGRKITKGRETRKGEIMSINEMTGEKTAPRYVNADVTVHYSILTEILEDETEEQAVERALTEKSHDDFMEYSYFDITSKETFKKKMCPVCMRPKKPIMDCGSITHECYWCERRKREARSKC